MKKKYIYINIIKNSEERKLFDTRKYFLLNGGFICPVCESMFRFRLNNYGNSINAYFPSNEFHNGSKTLKKTTIHFNNNQNTTITNYRQSNFM